MTTKYDIIFSIGPACRPAYYLELSKIRTCAYPFDWLGISLNTIIELFDADFKNFFESYHEQNKIIDNRYRNVIDDNGIICAHHIPINEPLTSGVQSFKELMQKRFTRLKDNIVSSKHVCMLTNQSIDADSIIDFLKAFKKFYPNKEITLINIRDTYKANYFKKRLISKNLSFIEFGFKDINKLGDNPKTNPMFWIGNEEEWLKVMSYLKERKNKNE